jgi:transglutaminase-like putative cysteine protease
MRVEFDQASGSQEARSLYWRGVAFDAYSEGRWERSRTAPSTTLQRSYAGPNTMRYHLLYADPTTLSNVLDDRISESLRQQIYLEPISDDVLFGASMPQAFELTERLGPRLERPQDTRNDEMRITHGTGIKYVAYSQTARPDSDVLRAALDTLPSGYESYRQVPAELPARIAKHARDITKDAKSTYDKVVAVEQWLESNLTYTLEMRSPGEQEPIDFFLFTRRKGHCEYFASAMTIMLRTLGIPARNVNGFLGGEWNEYDEYLAVRARDAHSWVEVYFDGVGWVTFDPTPSSSAGSSAEDDGGLAGRMRRYLDTVRFQWFQWVIEYDLHRQTSLFRGVGESFKSGGMSVKELFTAVRAWLGRHGPLLGGLVLGGAVFIFVLTRWRRRIRWHRPGGVRDPMSAIYVQAVLGLARRGHDRAPAATPREHARALTARAIPGAAALTELTNLYYARIYGGDDEPALLDRARALAADIERALREAPRPTDPSN